MQTVVVFAALICAAAAASQWAVPVSQHSTTGWNGQWNGAPSHVWAKPATTVYATHAGTTWGHNAHVVAPAVTTYGASPYWGVQNVW